jgi:hypothetical protein
VHTFVRLSFVYAKESDLKRIGYELEDLVSLRNEGDYKLDQVGSFQDNAAAQQAILDSQAMIDLLDHIDADAARQAAAIASITAGS